MLLHSTAIYRERSTVVHRIAVSTVAAKHAVGHICLQIRTPYDAPPLLRQLCCAIAKSFIEAYRHRHLSNCVDFVLMVATTS